MSTMREMEGDQAFLRSAERPAYERGTRTIRVVDLFCGAGGLTLGLAEAAHNLDFATEVPLAVDFDADILRVYAANFKGANAVVSDVAERFAGELGSEPTDAEGELSATVGPVDFLVGGPPCQGHSDLNNHTRRADPRNSFYERMGRAAEILRPGVVIIENVPTVRHDESGVVERTVKHLDWLGYHVAEHVVSLAEIGVPQTRKRHTVLAVRGLDVEPAEALLRLVGAPRRDLHWVIGDLERTRESPLDQPGNVSEDNRKRIDWLMSHPDEFDLPNDRRPKCHQGKHSYVSMYGQLKWNEPAQTITSGFGSMGQGRYVHPSRARTLTPHEAARIQFFPDWYDFTAGGKEMRRGRWAQMIGNAVPPKLTMEIGKHLIPLLPAIRSLDELDTEGVISASSAEDATNSTA